MKIIADEALKHPKCLDHRTEEDINDGVPQVRIRILEYGESSINLRAYLWSKDHADGFSLKCDLLRSIKQQFDVHGIEIPFPYRTIVFKKDLEAGT